MNDTPSINPSDYSLPHNNSQVSENKDQQQSGSPGYLGWQTLITIIVLPLASLTLGLLNLWDVLNKILTDPTEPPDPAGDAFFDMVFDTVQYSIWLAVALLLLLCWLLKWHRFSRVITRICLTVTTFELAICAVLLVLSITQYKVGSQLLADAALVWCINVVIFTIWYWFIDSGGPQRRLEGISTRPDLFFPQQASEIPGYTNWQPQLMDYAFLAFNHNMAFSPTDTLVLSRRCKFLVTLQTTFALLAFAVALSRAIGIV